MAHDDEFEPEDSATSRSPTGLPGLAKARAGARRLECAECGVHYRPQEEAEHRCEAADLQSARRERREGVLPDRRHAIKAEHRPPDKLRPMTEAISKRHDDLVWRSHLRHSEKAVGSAILRDLDWLTLTYFQSRKFLFERAGVQTRIGELALAALSAHGIIRRSTARRVADAGLLKHLHFDAHDPRLIQPTKYREFTFEWDAGMRLLEWATVDDGELENALKRRWDKAPRTDQMIGNPTDPTIGNRTDQMIGNRTDPLIGNRTDQKIDASTDLEIEDPRPSIKPPTSALSPNEGGPPEAEISPRAEGDPACALAATPLATAERAGPPAAARLASAHEAPRSEETSLSEEGCGEGESACLANASGIRDIASPIPNEIGVPDASSAGGGASPASTPVRFLPETSRAISALVGRCKRASEAAGLTKLDAVALFGWFVDRHKAGCPLEWLEAFARGAAQGGGEAADGRAAARAAGVNAFQYATKNPELYAHEGRRLLEAETTERVSAVYARAAEAAPPAPPLSREEQLRRLAELAEEEEPS